MSESHILSSESAGNSIRSLIYALAFIGVSVWWIFFVIWRPGFVNLLTGVSYRFSPLPVSSDTAMLARERALVYATRGGSGAEDIYFTSREVSHLVDVSRLYTPLSLALNIISALSWSALIIASAKKEPLRRAMRIASLLLAALIVIFGIALLLFPIFFDAFHQVLFPQGNWSFPANSLLIQIFPEDFWKIMLGSITLMLGATSGLFYLLSKPISKQ